MDIRYLIQELSRNQQIFKELLNGATAEVYTWKPKPEKWCMLEIICHLLDEEREDFRARTQHVLEHPVAPFIPINPTGWVQERDYMRQDFEKMLKKFLQERDQSISWLHSLKNPKWDNAHMHSKFGPMTAAMFANNWVVHDYLHIRQILNLKFGYLQQATNEPLSYAGNW